ncbi:hypothetical protein JAMGFMIE_01470 [Rheinheimera sp. MM224]|nr:hypothetical protein JAMGFMIE_01470 [Rheinheimera sp. MM224]
MQLNEQQAALSAQLESSENLTKSQKALAEFEQQIADIKEKKILTADQKSLLANEQQLRIEHQQNVALDEQLKKKNELIDLDNQRAGLDAMLRNQQQGYTDQLAAYGGSDKEIQRLKEEQKIREETNKMIAQLNAEKSSMSSETYQAQLEELQNYQDKSLEIYKNSYEQIAEVEADWAAGANKALLNYAEEYENQFQSMADAVNGILSSSTSAISDGLADIITGTSSVEDAFKSMALGMSNAVINALTEMAAEWLVYQAVQMIVGKSTQAGAATAMTFNALASQQMAAINAFASTAAIPIVGPALAPAAAATAIGLTAPFVTAVTAFSTSGIAGMAHDGIDNIPREGTWLLDAGERVLSPNQNKDLTNFLNLNNEMMKGYNEGLATMPKFDDGIPAMRGASAAEIGSVNRNDISISVPVVIHGDPDEKTLRLIQKATADGAAMAYRKISGDLATGRGDVSKAVQGGWSVSRRKR